jgi:hypothetical protein
MKTATFLIIFSIYIIFSESAFASFVDSSNSIFLSSKLQKQIGDHELFPAFWWDFIVKDVKSESDWTEAFSMCENLKRQAPNLVLRVQCQENFSDLLNLTRDWSRDLPLRTPAPSLNALNLKLDSALAQASLPMGDDAFMDILRVDPLGSWRELKALADKKVKINLKRQRGFFFDPDVSQIVIPIQLAFPPSNIALTARLKSITDMDEKNFFLIGPHGSYLQNQEQIMTDLHRVSWVGLGLLIIFGFSLIIKKKARVLLLAPAVVIAMLVSTLVTVALFGSIHGLTLSFGTAIVGLALDYGFQGVFNGKSPHLWRSNFFGLATTAIGLCILLTSSIPLLRQMMTFSLVGLSMAFSLFYFLISKWPEVFTVAPLNLNPKPNAPKTIFSLLLIFCSLMSFFVIKPTVDLSKFDYQKPEAFKSMKHLFTILDMRAPLFSISSSSRAFDKAVDEKAWADSHSIEVENLKNYIVSFESQKTNIRTWAYPDCAKFQKQVSAEKKNFFNPFFLNLCQASPLDPAHYRLPRSYLDHLRGGDRWLTLWLPKTDAQEKLVRAQYPDAIAIREIVTQVPRTLSEELMWMAPLSIFLAGLLLFVYYRSWAYTLSALIPFFTGIGLVSLSVFIFRLDISFVTIIGLVMVFGFSIDYGIFATDVNRGLKGQSVEGVWTGLTFAILATCAGFFPLIFCKHPILLGLGQTLFVGGLGTYIGAIWGVPGFSKIRNEI